MCSVISIEGLSKKYLIAHHQSTARANLHDAFSDGFMWAANMLRRRSLGVVASDPRNEEFWALKNVNLEIQQGDRVGIIGRNGAGKSTLLKILSRITEPTAGKISIKGRVSSLLEVGTGFHPDLTGRENIFLNGAILGMTKKEINRKFDEIVDFAEVEKFIDTPVKHYSSGMYVRLAFAVASNLEPDILIIDEVLAVGDAAFQRKCLGKMEDESKKAGRTVVFVSHNTKAIQILCNIGVLLNAGTVQKAGSVLDAVNSYGQLCTQSSNSFDSASYPVDPSKRMQLKRCWIAKKETEFFQIEFKVEIETRAVVDGAYIALDIFDHFNETVYWTSDVGSQRFNHPKNGTMTLSCRLPKFLLNPGKYLAHFAIVSLGRGIIDNHETVKLTFEVNQQSNELLSSYNIQQPGYCGIPSIWDSQ